MVLVWGVQGAARPGQEERIEQTRRYLDSLGPNRSRLLIPTPVLTEYLQFFEDATRRAQFRHLVGRFEIAPFDKSSAYLAAELAHRARKRRRFAGIGRQAVKTDLQIIATAIVHGAEEIVTDESEHFTRLAGHRIRISAIPETRGPGQLQS